MKYNYKMTISYDGTHYSGWQIQKNGLAIQQLIQSALSIKLKEEIKIISSGRTDAKVHALAQVANFFTSKKLQENQILYSLNGMLPKDIRIKQLEEAPLTFHARFSAQSKIYHYHLWLDPILDPFKRLYVTQIKGRFDLDRLRHGIPYFLGTHDFTSFANEAHMGSAAHDAIRTIKQIDIVFQEGGIRLEFEGDGFLYKMVRNIVGFLLEIASGKREVHEIPIVLAAKDRKKAGMTAPAQGLFLVHVVY